MGATEDKGLATFFRWHGRNVAARPWIFIALALIITSAVAFFSLPYFRDVNVDDDPNLVWVAPGSTTALQKRYFDAAFDPFFRVSQVIVTLDPDAPDSPPPSPSGILRREFLSPLLRLQQALYAGVASDGTSLSQVCYKPVPGLGCLVETPLDYFNSDPARIDILTEADIQKYLACTAAASDCDKCADACDNCVKCSVGVASTCPYTRLCVNALAIPIMQNVVLGGITPNTGNTSFSVCSSGISASSLIITFLLSDTPEQQEKAAQWEKDVFLPLVSQYTAPGVRVSYLAERSIADQLKIVDTQNQYVVFISYMAMLLYIAIALGKFPHPIAMRANLGIQGIFIVALAVLSALGITFVSGLHITMIVLEVVPFLILAIGVDNMFITGRAFDRRWWGLLGARTRARQEAAARRATLTPRLRAFTSSAPPVVAGPAASATSVECGVDVATAISEALAEVGPTMTAAAACEVMAFIVGITLDIPALKQFCIVAAIAVTVDFLLQMTWFVAAVVIDARRQESRRLDLVPCVELRGPGVSQTRCAKVRCSFSGPQSPIVFSDDDEDFDALGNLQSFSASGGQTATEDDPTGYGYGPAGMGIDLGLDVGYARPGPWLMAAVKAMAEARAAAAAASQTRSTGGRGARASLGEALLSAVDSGSLQGGSLKVHPPPLNIDAAYARAISDSPLGDDVDDSINDGPDGHFSTEAALLTAWGQGGGGSSSSEGNAVSPGIQGALGDSSVKGAGRSRPSFSSGLGDNVSESSPSGMPTVYVRALARRRAEVASRNMCGCPKPPPPEPCCPGGGISVARFWFIFNRGNFVRRAMGRWCAPLVLSYPFRALVIIAWVLMIFVSCTVLSGLKLGLEQQLILPEGSYLATYFDDQSHLGDAGPPAYIVLQNVNYTAPGAYGNISDLAAAVGSLSSVLSSPVYSWVSDYESWRSSDPITRKTSPVPCPPLMNATTSNFATLVAQYIYDISIDSDCCQTAAFCGGQYATDVQFLWGTPKVAPPSRRALVAVGDDLALGGEPEWETTTSTSAFVSADAVVMGEHLVGVTRVGNKDTRTMEAAPMFVSRSIVHGGRWGDEGTAVDDGGCDISVGFVQQRLVHAAAAVDHTPVRSSMVLRAESAAAVGFPPSFLTRVAELAPMRGVFGGSALSNSSVPLIPCHILTSRLRTQHTPLRNQSDFIASKQVMQSALKKLEGKLPTLNFALLGVPMGPEDPGAGSNDDTDNVHTAWLPDAPGGSAWPYSLVYVYYDQYDYIRGIAVTNVLAAIAAVFFASLLVAAPAVALIATFLVASSTLCLVGWVWLLNPHGPVDPFGGGPYGVDINAISVVNLVTATGLCVEFVIHIAAAFAGAAKAAEERMAACVRKAVAGGIDAGAAEASALELEGGPSAVRSRLARAALVEMGSSVVTGITLTKLVGVLILALAPSQLFRLYYFRMYLGIIVMGAFHGLALLPVLLATFGLPSW